MAVKFEGVVTDCGEASCQTDQTTVFANDLVLDHQVVAEIERNKRHLRIKIDQTTWVSLLQAKCWNLKIVVVSELIASESISLIHITRQEYVFWIV